MDPTDLKLLGDKILKVSTTGGVKGRGEESEMGSTRHDRPQGGHDPLDDEGLETLKGVR